MTQPRSGARATQPYTGVRIIEVGGTIAAAGATKTLSDFGADVIKIEPPAGGEVRRVAPFPNDVPHLDRGAYHLALDTGKRSLALDLSSPSGVQVLLDVARGADLTVLQVPPAEARPLLAALDTLGDEAPSTVTMTPHGLDGPLADHEEDDISIFARTNRMLRHSYTDEEPLRYAPYVPTMQWASTATAVAAATIWATWHGGERRAVEVAAVEALSGNVDSWYVTWAFTGVDLPRDPDTRLGYPNGYFECSDGYLIFSAGTEPFFSRLCGAIGKPEFATDPRFKNPLEKPNHYDEFMSHLEPYLAARTRHEAFRDLQAHGVMCAPLLDVRDAMEDAQAVARGSFVEVQQPAEVGTQTIAGPPFRLAPVSERHPPEIQTSDAPPAWQARPAPTLGQHTAEVLTEAGYSSDEQLALFRAAVTA